MTPLLWLSSIGLQVRVLNKIFPSIQVKLTILRVGEDFDAFRPTLTLYIQRSEGNGVAIDATLSPDTRKYLQDLASRQSSGRHLLSGSVDLAVEKKGEGVLDTP